MSEQEELQQQRRIKLDTAEPNVCGGCGGLIQPEEVKMVISSHAFTDIYHFRCYPNISFVHPLT